LVSLNFGGVDSVNTNDVHTIAWPQTVNVKSIRKDIDRAWSLTFWDQFRQLLELHELFVRKSASIVNDFKSVFQSALVAIFGLIHFRVLQNQVNFILAVAAPEMSSVHFRNDFRTTDDDSLD
jgi:hypothetical protein